MSRSLRCLLISAAVLGVNVTSALAQQLEVVDSSGTKLGDVDSIQSFTPIVAFNLDERWFSLSVLQNGFVGNTPLGYQSFDCSGTAFLVDFGAALSASVMLPPAAIAPPGNTVYLPVPGSASEFTTLNSSLNSAGTCSSITQPIEAQAFPAQAIEDLSTRFTPPYTLQAIVPAAAP